jgi:hypothetical protein
VRALLEVAVHERNRGRVVCCWNWSESGNVLADLCEELDSLGRVSEPVTRRIRFQLLMPAGPFWMP